MDRRSTVGLIAIVVIVAVAMFAGCVEEEKAAIPLYQIVEQKDISHANAVRLSIRVVVPSNITEQEVKDVSGDVVKMVTKSQDVNAIAILMYDRIEDAYGAYTVDSVDWAPYGDWARAGEVKTGDYSKHQYNFGIKDKVGNIDESGRPPEREFEIHDYYDARLFEETKKLIEAEDAGLPYKYADQEELENAVRTEVANKYGISEEDLDKIYIKVWTYIEHGHI